MLIFSFCTVYFNRMTLTGTSLSRSRLDRESTADRDKTTKEIYDEIAAVDEPNQNIMWYHRLWRALPFLPTWHVFMRQNAITWSCCRKDSDLNKRPWYYKAWHFFVNALRILIILVALFLTVIAIMSTFQAKTALAKLPESFKISYGESLINETLVVVSTDDKTQYFSCHICYSNKQRNKMKAQYVPLMKNSVIFVHLQARRMLIRQTIQSPIVAPALLAAHGMICRCSIRRG